jgi:hypothetical protein
VSRVEGKISILPYSPYSLERAGKGRGGFTADKKKGAAAPWYLNSSKPQRPVIA